MGVDLRRADALVPEQLLDGAQVAAALDEVRGERVAQRVRADPVGQAVRRGVAADDVEHALPRDAPAAVVQHQRVALWRLAEKRAAPHQVARDGLGGGPAARHDALAAALAETADEPGLTIDVLGTQADELRHAQAGAIEQLQRGAVAQAERRRVGRLDQADRLVGGQRPGNAAALARQRHVADTDRAGALAGAVAQERARCGHAPPHRGRCEAPVGERVGVRHQLIAGNGVGVEAGSVQERLQLHEVAPVRGHRVP